MISAGLWKTMMYVNFRKAIGNTTKQVLLIDAAGALLSAIMLGLVLPHLVDYVGMSPNVLRALAVPPLVFIIFDIIAYRWSEDRWRQAVAIIAVANVVYCCISIFLMYQHKDILLPFGYLYFVVEVIIVLVVAGVEFKIARSK